jgi:hypothetical protein
MLALFNAWYGQIEVQLDGASSWTPVAVNSSYNVTDLQDGDHTLVARSRCAAPAH